MPVLSNDLHKWRLYFCRLHTPICSHPAGMRCHDSGQTVHIPLIPTSGNTWCASHCKHHPPLLSDMRMGNLNVPRISFRPSASVVFPYKTEQCPLASCCSSSKSDNYIKCLCSSETVHTVPYTMYTFPQKHFISLMTTTYLMCFPLQTLHSFVRHWNR